ncbi:RNA-binding S4 domain-containing protein [Bombilactobacillus folatiphilus]|uniref:RQC P-site tRNA stabilizing factor n=1 Tax=Bombilactobacillus folatiphilus TaxID=2923362 RepID=A0ABY4P9Q4_9LACO|nr:RNA-binding S4 domain-containing protein [Bombilactobacillus folatiphilus]UQS82334.1 RNA-binding S4 domain-containing protein [Bombilactobacillus folatiphilus]
MRLDKYLKLSRLVKRRTIAKELADKGRIELNGRVAKSASDVTIGDQLILHYGDRQIKVEILATPEIVKKEDASSMYQRLD